MKKSIILIVICFAARKATVAQNKVPVKPRVLISTDIGGTDPDDNQSMAHLLMYSNEFALEGLVSSPSYGNGSKEEILRMIDLYAKDLPALRAHAKGFPTPGYLRSICKQGVRRAAPYAGFAAPTEGSRWIIHCAKKASPQPLWILVWGGLDDLAQALHDAPEIQDRIRVYFIGGPNKKWCVNSYAYIARNFPDLWLIESNATFTGMFTDDQAPAELKKASYYDNWIKGHGFLGTDFKNYYKGEPKMGDTPSLLYMMDGDPNHPEKESWGGSYIPFSRSPRRVFDRDLTVQDTVPVYSVIELILKGPVLDLAKDSPCFKMDVHAGIGLQSWPGYYLGAGLYGIRYSPKKAEKLAYEIRSDLPGFQNRKGSFVVRNEWPGKRDPQNYALGNHWFTDRPDPDLFCGYSQGARTVTKWRNAFLKDWAKRWSWLK